MDECHYSLTRLSAKIKAERIPTFVVTRKPVESWQVEAMDILSRNEWVEVRFNESLHAKVFVASTNPESESFALFGSANLTGQAVVSNLEVGMMLYARGFGRKLLDQLNYWATNHLRVLPESRLHQPMRLTRKILCQHSKTGSA